jgi:butyryl-CoA dehydrogenase
MKELTQEEQLAIQTVRSFVKNELAPMAKKIDEDDIFPIETVRKLGELGLMGMFVPNEWEGAGLSHYLYALAIEEISSASAAVGTIVSAHSSLAVWPILKFGTDAQKKRFLPPMAKGEAIGCFCLTEPEAGSDAANLKTSYRHASDGYTISGAKAFITNASRAKTGIVFATKDRSLRHRGISTFLLDMETPGVLVGKPEKKLGIHGADSCPVDFDEVFVPKECLLGNEGDGFRIAMATLDGGRIGIAAQAVGIAKGAFERAAAYARTRTQFGKPIIEFQAIGWMLADMLTKIEASRMLVLRAAELKDSGGRSTLYSSMAKLFAAETAMETATKAVQVLGGYGYIKDYELERFFRDAKITEIYEGSSEIQRLVLANELKKEDFAL